MADTNPANFANLPKGKVQEIASKGGKASHVSNGNTNGNDKATAATDPGRNADGTFVKGSEAAKEAGHKGGLHSHDNDDKKENGDNKEESGRRDDGTFLPNSSAAKEAGHKGGLAAAASNN